MTKIERLMPTTPIEGHTGFYPVCNAQEWDELPIIYKAMDWFPTCVYNDKQFHAKNEMTIPEYVVFDVVYAEPYRIRASVKVHVQEVQKILFCAYENPQFHLYSISHVVFQNGMEWGAKWTQDTKTGAFAVWAGDRIVGMQGGYRGYVPAQIEETDDGYKWKGFVKSENRCHYTLLNPFTGK